MTVTTLTNTLHNKRPWWREPMLWLIIGLPLSAVIASFTTYYIASKNADTLVKEGYQKVGFTVEQTLASDRMAAKLGISADLQVQDDILSVRLANTAIKASPVSITLILAHSTDAAKDVALQLYRGTNGIYLTKAPNLPDGRRTLIVESEDRLWRLKGIWQAPFTGRLHLSPVPAE